VGGEGGWEHGVGLSGGWGGYRRAEELGWWVRMVGRGRGDVGWGGVRGGGGGSEIRRII